MGFDITYHPIRPVELNAWYFNLDFNAIRSGDYTELRALADRYSMPEEAYTLYRAAVDAGAQVAPGEGFENRHGFYAACAIASFRKFYYTRDSAFSFLVDEYPEFSAYTVPWAEVLDRPVTNPSINRLNMNYSSGVYIPQEKVVQLLDKYDGDPSVRGKLDNYFSGGKIRVFWTALEAAEKTGSGLLEAAEVVRPNPLNLEESDYHGYLLNCDLEGALLYQQSMQAEYREIEKREGLAEGEFARRATYETVNHDLPQKEKKPEEKKGFFKKLFG